jgi:hypothetical protein
MFLRWRRLTSNHCGAMTEKILNPIMIPPTKPLAPSDAAARIAQLERELDAVTRACDAALATPGNHFFLLRRKWKLTQELFQIQSELLLHSSGERPPDSKTG